METYNKQSKDTLEISNITTISKQTLEENKSNIEKEIAELQEQLNKVNEMLNVLK